MGKGGGFGRSICQKLSLSATRVCHSHLGESGLIRGGSFHPGDGAGGVQTAGRGCVAECSGRTAVRVIPAALGLQGDGGSTGTLTGKALTALSRWPNEA